MSLRDVAKVAGVSVGTASNVLNKPGIVAPETLQKVQKAIDQLGFVPNGFARYLRAGYSRTVGLVLPDVSNPFFTEVARGVEAAATKQNYAVFLCNSDESNNKEERYINILMQQLVRGVLITPAGATPDHMNALRERGIAVTLLDHAANTSAQCSVSVDDVRGGEIAIEHLVNLGHTNIAFVGGPNTVAQVSDRATGASNAANKHGITLNKFETKSMNTITGEQIVTVILANPEIPSAIFCANDLLAIGVIRGLTASGIRIPQDISVIGYDDIAFASFAAVPLTSIQQPAFQLGFTAAELLLAECEAPEGHAHQNIKFEPKLIVRESTALSVR